MSLEWQNISWRMSIPTGLSSFGSEWQLKHSRRLYNPILWGVKVTILTLQHSHDRGMKKFVDCLSRRRLEDLSPFPKLLGNWKCQNRCRNQTKTEYDCFQFTSARSQTIFSWHFGVAIRWTQCDKTFALMSYFFRTSECRLR